MIDWLTEWMSRSFFLLPRVHARCAKWLTRRFLSQKTRRELRLLSVPRHNQSYEKSYRLSNISTLVKTRRKLMRAYRNVVVLLFCSYGRSRSSCPSIETFFRKSTVHLLKARQTGWPGFMRKRTSWWNARNNQEVCGTCSLLPRFLFLVL